MTRTLLLACVGVLGLACAAPAQQDGPTRADLAPLLEPIRAEHDVPALAALLLRGDDILAIGATGVRARGSEERVTIDDRWHLGSCGKAMTATLAGVLVEAGEVSWETTIAAAFAGVTNPATGEPLPGAYDAVTLLHLLQNRSGLPDNLGESGALIASHASRLPPRTQREHFLSNALAWQPVGKPGAVFRYSNSGFTIAGAMLERAADEPFEELMQRRLFAPLGITSAAFGAPGTPDVVDQPRGHRAGKAQRPGPLADNPRLLSPAGRISMTLPDWARFVSLHLAGERGVDRLVSARTIRLLHEPAPRSDGEEVREGALDYAGGWGVTRRPWAKGDQEGDVGRVLTHSGSNTMWFCTVWVAPERNLAFLAATNQGDADAPKAVDRAIAAMIRELDTLLPKADPASPAP